jgi:hypothetical protein
MNKKNIFTALLIAWLCGWCAAGVQAQCTTYAGDVTPQDFTICQNSATFQAPAVSGTVLDNNDVLAYIIHDGTTNQLGSIFSTGTSTGLFTAPFPMEGTYTISAVAGSRIPGTVLINYNDPCLSVKYVGMLTVLPIPSIITNTLNITCLEPVVYIGSSINVSNTGPVTASWTGPGIVNTNGQIVQVDEPGIYTLTVTTQAGCVNTATALVQVGDPLVNIIQEDPDPCDSDPSTQILRCSLPFNAVAQSYLWTNGETTSSITVPNVTALGTAYCVTVTFSTNCTATACYTTVASDGFDPYIQSWPFCDSNVVYLALNEYWPNATYEWSTQPGNLGSGGILVNEPGFYAVTVTLPQGCSAVASYFLEEGVVCGLLRGQVIADLDNSCTHSAGDYEVGGVTLEIIDLSDQTSYLVVTQPDGTWSKGLKVGNYSVTVYPPNGVWEPCVQTQVVVNTNFDTTTVADFLLKPLESCPRLELDLITPFLRRCFTGTYTANYCNTGSVTAEDAYIDLKLDPFLDYNASSVPATNQGNNTWRFQLGDVAPGDCGEITVTVAVSCNAILGQTHCTEATVFPNAPCGDNVGGNWSGASLRLTADCDGDSLRFTLANVGTAPMSNPLEYVVIEDVVMMKSVPPPTIILAPGVPHIESVPANGATWYVAAKQEPNHPGNSFPSLSVEGCTTGTTFSTGYVNAFPQDDADYWIDIDCTPNVGAYDPNDKQGFPTGYGAQHQIGRGVELEYLIRFQNTGTDTAFTVVIRDTLSAWLDPLTVRPGASSHSYRFDFYGEGANMKFVFDNIMLPDSNVSQAGSQGYISYRVSPKADVPFGSVIHNNAAIYFDFNEPVITNTTFHRVDTNFVVVSNWEAVWPGVSVQVQPNPMSEQAVVLFNGLPESTEVRVEILDITGRVQQSGTTNNGRWVIGRGQMPSGTYIIRASVANGEVGTGKLLVD